MNKDDSDDHLKSIVNRHQKKIFPLVYYLVGSDSDKAYEVTVSSFVETFLAASDLRDDEEVLIILVKAAIDISRESKVMPLQTEPKFINAAPEKKKILLILRDVLQGLAYEEKVLLLLRDQMHLSYQRISSILDVSQSDVRRSINQARINIRKKLEGALL